MYIKEPPKFLYYGGYLDVANQIEQKGITSTKNVSLTEDIYIAYNQGSKHGQPVICIVDSKRMYEDGYVFYQHVNNWYVETIPPEYFVQIRIDDVLDLNTIDQCALQVIHPGAAD